MFYFYVPVLHHLTSCVYRKVLTMIESMIEDIWLNEDVHKNSAFTVCVVAVDQTVYKPSPYSWSKNVGKIDDPV